MNRIRLTASFLCLFLSFSTAPAQETSGTDSPKKDVSAPTPTAMADAPAKKPLVLKAGAKGLEIHRPLLSPSWGRLIQYKKEQILALSEKNRETLHEFVLQDDQGVVRVAIFHESASGEGYWEVYVWDQP